MPAPTSRTGSHRSSAPSADDYRLLVETATEYAIFMLDVEGRVTSWNAGAEKAKGYAASEIIGEHFSRFFTPEDVAAGRPERELRIATEVGRAEDEGWRVRKDGSLFWASVVTTALRDEHGTLRGFAKFTRDLTERRAVQERLRESEARYHHLVDAVSDYAIFLLDPTGHVATWNQGARKTKGYEPDEILGRHFSIFYTPEDRAAGRPAEILETVRREGRFEDEGWRVRKDGSRFWASVVITALRDEQGAIRGFAKVTRDLTAQRLAAESRRELLREQVARATAQESERRMRESEEAARAAASRAETANRVKDEFLATVSHELRTPLNAILGWASLLRDGNHDPATRKGLEVIRRNAEMQAHLVEDILDVSRIITGKLRIDSKMVNLAALMREAIDVVRPSATAKRLHLDVADLEPVLLPGDPGRLRQVMWNLLSNAVKFSELEGTISVAIAARGSSAVLSVEDTGRGIEAEFLPYVFDRFMQADGSTTRHHGGLGLGLSIVRHIVELHGGQVRAESGGPGKGARFTVTLPVPAVVPGPLEEVAEASSRPSAAPAPPAWSDVALAGIRVLVVEDDADSLELLGQVLESAGAEVVSADSAQAGMEALGRLRPDVVVSDVGMPDEDGYSFMRRVRALEASDGGATPSIALTAYTRSEERPRALSAGFNAYLSKPVNPQDLVAAVAGVAPASRSRR